MREQSATSMKSLNQLEAEGYLKLWSRVDCTVGPASAGNLTPFVVRLIRTLPVDLQTEQVSARLVKSPEELDDFLTTTPEQMTALRAVLVQSSALKPASDVNILQTWEALTRSKGGLIIQLPPDLDYLEEGDVVRINPGPGELQVIYRFNSLFNHLFVTERCNSKCLMCSQPPRAINDDFRVDDLLAAIPLMAPETPVLGFTGGEITLLYDRFLELLTSVKQHLPQAHVQVLSNGRLFAYSRYAQQVADIGIKSLLMCVPLYSDVDARHDFIVQAQGAFDQTVRGLMNLGRAEVSVEIRVVIHRQTFSRLPQLATFIARNFPFVSHIALMGLEITGFTRANLEALWIDPVEYQSQLGEAVEILDAAGLNVSIYNQPLCLLPRELWRFSRQSISDWKNIYLPECEACTMKSSCGGFFASSVRRHSDFIQPFEEVTSLT